ncbi:hypothetical protein ADUPG1_013203 [Aduncisulcus paluster]|uniref:Uncharacterized protein n=1 Tax=Aduncisulcus paluster TaxID=2918883 RepID=A0ABQ5K6U8_9EUKA|nr:hypothetical protein ADUPG1_013203 [Aduncisulcus paluster]
MYLFEPELCVVLGACEDDVRCHVSLLDAFPVSSLDRVLPSSPDGFLSPASVSCHIPSAPSSAGSTMMPWSLLMAILVLLFIDAYGYNLKALKFIVLLSYFVDIHLVLLLVSFEMLRFEGGVNGAGWKQLHHGVGADTARDGFFIKVNVRKNEGVNSVYGLTEGIGRFVCKSGQLIINY